MSAERIGPGSKIRGDTVPLPSEYAESPLARESSRAPTCTRIVKTGWMGELDGNGIAQEKDLDLSSPPEIDGHELPRIEKR